MTARAEQIAQNAYSQMVALAEYYYPHKPVNKNTMAKAQFLDTHFAQLNRDTVAAGIAKAFSK